MALRITGFNPSLERGESKINSGIQPVLLDIPDYLVGQEVSYREAAAAAFADVRRGDIKETDFSEIK